MHRKLRQAPRIRVSKLAIAAGDLLAVLAALLLALAFKVRYITLDPVPLSNYLVVVTLSLPVWPLSLRSRHLYESRFTGRRADEMRRILDAVLLAVAGLVVLDFFLKTHVARTWVVQAGLLAAVFLALFREVVRQVFQARRRKGIGLRRVILVGDNEEANAIGQMLRDDPSIGYRVVGRVVQRPGRDPDDVRRKLLDDTMRAIADADAHGVVIAITAIDPHISNHLVRALAYSGVHLELSSALSDISADRLSMRPMGRIPVVYVEPVARFGWRPVAKRAFDIVVATSMLVVFSPLLAVVAVAVRRTSPGPALFRQERVGQWGSTFPIYKFRTMAVDAEAQLVDLRHRNEADGPLFKLKEDPRVTRLGHVLRSTSIDELPQLWNVVRGEMSLVGPRPALPIESGEWSIDLFDRVRVRPGITGMWQVSGRSDAGFGEYTRLDLYYVDNWSLVVDLTILAKTIPAVLTRRGAA